MHCFIKSAISAQRDFKTIYVIKVSNGSNVTIGNIYGIQTVMAAAIQILRMIYDHTGWASILQHVQ